MVGDNEELRPKVTIVRSKSDAPISEHLVDDSNLFAPILTAEESLAISSVENSSISSNEAIVDELMAVEEAFIDEELDSSPKKVRFCFFFFLLKLVLFTQTIQLFFHCKFQQRANPEWVGYYHSRSFQVTKLGS